MFARKVMLIALLAVVLVGSFMVGSGVEEKTLRHRRKPRAEFPVAVTASLTRALDQVSSSVLGSDSTDLLAALKERRPRHRRVVAAPTGSIQAASYANADDSTDLLAGVREKRHRRPRMVEAAPAGSIQVAGGIAALDPSNG